MWAGDPTPQDLLAAFKMLTSRAGGVAPYSDLVREIGREAADRMVELKLIFYCPALQGWDGEGLGPDKGSFQAPCVPSLVAMKHVLDHEAAFVPRAAAAAALRQRGERRSPATKAGSVANISVW